MTNRKETFRQSQIIALENQILNFWTAHTLDDKYGGFVGEVFNDNQKNYSADKSCVLNTRILWTFSAACNFRKQDAYLEMAKRAYQYIIDYFVDDEEGGLFWLLRPDGTPAETRKQIYANAFGIYALSEYYKATQHAEALDLAKSLYSMIEAYSHDLNKGGYLEAFSRNWQPIEDMRLSDWDLNAAKTFNTHLHILEAYTNLLDAWQSDELKATLKSLVELVMQKFYSPQQKQFLLFFDEDWHSQSRQVSYGHDIEATWLLCEAAKQVGDTQLINWAGQVAVMVTDAVLDRGTAPDGSLYYEQNEAGEIYKGRHWWPQSEAIVGLLNTYEITGHEKYLQSAIRTWDFIQRHLRMQNGEWFWSVNDDYTPDWGMSKVNPWKGPYHNARGCIEAARRL